MAVEQSILVLGAGELGTSILHALSSYLAQETSKISLLVRPNTLHNPSATVRSTLESLEARKINLIPGDVIIDSVADLTSCFSAYTTIIGATGMTFPPGTQTKILTAVLAAKVPLYIPWQFGVDYDVIGANSAQDLFSEQLVIRNRLREQNATRWVIVSVGMFTSFLFEPEFGVVLLEKNIVRALGSWENKVTVTTVEDIGKVVAHVVSYQQDVDGVVFIAGQTITYRELAGVVEEVSRKQVVRELWDMEFLRAELAKDPENRMKKYRVVFGEGTGVSWDEKETFSYRKGMKLKDAKTWLEERLHQG